MLNFLGLGSLAQLGLGEGFIVRPPVPLNFREMFPPRGDWYQARLSATVIVDKALWDRCIAYLEVFLTKPNYQSELRRLRIQERLAMAKTFRDHVHSPDYRQSLSLQG